MYTTTLTISQMKVELMEQRVNNCKGDQKKLFLSHKFSILEFKLSVLPECTSSFTLASPINMFYDVARIMYQLFYFGISNKHGLWCQNVPALLVWHLQQTWFMVLPE